MHAQPDFIRFYIKCGPPDILSPTWWYRAALCDVWDRVTRWEQDRLRVTLPGKVIASMTDDAITVLVEHVLGDDDAKITRFDLAWDFETTRDAEADYHTLLDLGQNAALIQSGTGYTLYVGSRRSACFVRQYDKRSEQNARTGVDVGFDWLRVELEAKVWLAQPAARSWLEAGGDDALSYVAHRTLLPVLSDIDAMATFTAPPRVPAHDPFTFVERYQSALRRAYQADSARFTSIVGGLPDA